MKREVVRAKVVGMKKKVLNKPEPEPEPEIRRLDK
jgi:hypothetical protein